VRDQEKSMRQLHAHHPVLGAVLGTAFLFGGGLLAPSAGLAASDTVPTITPAGITLQAINGGPCGSLGRTRCLIRGWTFGDEQGRTLYTYAKDTSGVSQCVKECTQTWIPVRPIAGAVASGGWSIINHPDGGKQWAFREKPVYSNAKDTQGVNAGDMADGGAWRTLWYEVEKPKDIPAGFAVRDVPDAVGQVLVENSGHTLYSYTGKVKRGKAPPCPTESCVLSPWVPVDAAALAQPTGEFSILRREDGSRQWAFRGKALFTYAGDKRPDAVNGQGVDQYEPVVLARHFLPADIKVVQSAAGAVYADSKTGKTLYARNAYIYRDGGHSARMNISFIPSVSRDLGTDVCSGECLKSWQPLVAPADAKRSGFWAVATQKDGVRQWIYKGFPVFTFAKDRRAGDILGHDRFELRVNHSTDVDPKPIAVTMNSTGLFWTYIFPETLPERTAVRVGTVDGPATPPPGAGR
jgi:predicted lipoprotein with Yx(FWY)xxD motif